VPLTFMPWVGGNGNLQGGGTPGNPAFLLLAVGSTLKVSGRSDAGQEPITGMREGLLPFSPFAHDPTAFPHYGLQRGVLYTLRWASSFNSNGNNDSRMCPGDRQDAMRELARSGSASDRGYIEVTSSSVIRDAIVYDYQTVFRGIGDTVEMTGGTKQTQRDALQTRIGQDSDPFSDTYAEYMENNEGNGRRLVAVPINTGHPDFRIVQIAAFFLQRAERYDTSGNEPFCAEYVGSWVKGASNKGAEDSGAYTIRLVQ
jgi:hypothetical protein